MNKYLYILSIFLCWPSFSGVKDWTYIDEIFNIKYKIDLYAITLKINTRYAASKRKAVLIVLKVKLPQKPLLSVCWLVWHSFLETGKLLLSEHFQMQKKGI